jgi:hypothetical protein
MDSQFQKFTALFVSAGVGASVPVYAKTLCECLSNRFTRMPPGVGHGPHRHLFEIASNMPVVTSTNTKPAAHVMYSALVLNPQIDGRSKA